MTAFAQNYLLVPYVSGDAVVRRDQIKWVESVGKVTDVTIGVDPAISEKTLSDEFAVTVTLTSDGIRHVCECIALREKEKEIVNALGVIKDAYDAYKRQYPDASIRVNVETVAYQKVLATALKERHMSVNSITPTKDKVMRLMERQGDIETGKIVFYKDGNGVRELVEQLVAFPNAPHDDKVDSFYYSVCDA